MARGDAIRDGDVARATFAFCVVVGRKADRLAGADRVTVPIGAERLTPAERLGAAMGARAIDRPSEERIGADARPEGVPFDDRPRWAAKEPSPPNDVVSPITKTQPKMR